MTDDSTPAVLPNDGFDFSFAVFCSSDEILD
jgi:hypothetical protein